MWAVAMVATTAEQSVVWRVAWTAASLAAKKAAHSVELWVAYLVVLKAVMTVAHLAAPMAGR